MTEQEELQYLLANSPKALPDDPSSSGWSTSQIKEKHYKGLVILYNWIKAIRTAYIQTENIVNALNDNSTDKPLSANMGKTLKELIDSNKDSLDADISRIDGLLASNDTSLDTIQKIVNFIKNNKSLIDGISSGMINVSAIVDNLLSTDSTKVLSAKQGKVLKDLLDAEINNRQTAVANEILARQNADELLQNNINAEIGKLTNGTTIVDKAYKDHNGNNIDSTYVKISNIINALNDTSTNKPLSAAQGKALKDMIDAINTLLASDTTTLDTLQEIVNYIKNNKSLIDGITITKMAFSDLVKNLTTNNDNLPLSASMGYTLKSMIDVIKDGTNIDSFADVETALDNGKNYANNIYSLATNNIAVKDTSSNILALTSNQGVAVATDNGHWYYWNGTQYVDGGVYQASQTATETFTYSSFSQLAQQNKQASYFVSASQLANITDAGALVTATGGVVVNVYNNAFNGNQYVLMLATDQVNRTYYALYNITGVVNTAWKDTEVIKYNNSWNTETFETIATGTLMRVIRKKNSHYTTLSNIGDLADAVGDITIIFIPMVYGGQYGLFIAYDQAFNEYCAIYNYAGVINTKFYKVRETRIGKSLSVFGDSISAQSYYTSPLQNVYRYGIGNKNYAVSGASYSNLSSAGKIADQITNASTSVDFVLIFAGTNDFALDCPLGTESDNDYTTFYGALNQTFIALRTKYPSKSIFVSTILQRNTTSYPDQPTGMVNNIGLSVDDYNAAIKKVAARYGCFIIDSYNESGIVKDINLSTYTQDGLHPNTAGGLRLAKLFDSYFKIKPIY